MSHIKKVYVMTTESTDCISLVHDVAAAIKEAGATAGILHVLVPKAGAGLMIHQKNSDLDSHVADNAALLPRAISLPVIDGGIPLAPYEEVFLVDHEPCVQRREVIITISPEPEAPSE